MINLVSLTKRSNTDEVVGDVITQLNLTIANVNKALEAVNSNIEAMLSSTHPHQKKIQTYIHSSRMLEFKKLTSNHGGILTSVDEYNHTAWFKEESDMLVFSVSEFAK